MWKIFLDCPCTAEVEKAVAIRTIRICDWREKGTAILTMIVQAFLSVAITTV